MKHPSVIQLSRLKAPIVGKGRPYTVDFGIAKPLYKQLLSKLSVKDCSSRNRVPSTGPPTNDLFSRGYPLRIRGRFVLLLTPLLLALYLALIMPLTTPSRIVYADPIAPLQPIPPIALLTLPTVAHVEPLQPIYSILMPFGTYANNYAPGNCTYGVASRLPVPDSWGNANNWAFNASNQGLSVSNIPRVGAIAQTGGDSYLGHVGIVTAINPDGSFTVWEENYYGLGATDERTTDTLEFPNFIYI